MISIGADDGAEYSGVYVPITDANTKNIYYNSIYVGGTSSAGDSYGFLRGNNTTPIHARNNIFSNFRTGGAGSHYGIGTLNTAWNSTYVNSNGYYSANSATIGNWNGDDDTFDEWVVHSGEDAHNLSNETEPEFTDASICDLHLDPINSCDFSRFGEPIVTVTVDYDGDARHATYPDIGADEFVYSGDGAYTWTGKIDTDWDDIYNWTCVEMPDGAAAITIPDVVNDPILQRALPATTLSCNTIDIETNADLFINPGNSLTMTGAINIDGTLTLQSPSDGEQSGSFIDNGTITGAGVMHAERFFTVGVYHYFSSPIENAGGNANSSLFCTSASGYFNPNLYTYDETFDLNGWTGAGSETTNPTGTDPFEPDSLVPGWEFVRENEAASNVNLTQGTGYAFYDESNKLVTFIGDPATGDKSYSGLSHTVNDPFSDGDIRHHYDGWHLIANPYPSSIDWDNIAGAAGANLTNLDNAIYVWVGDHLTGAYAEYVNETAGGVGGLDQFVAPMQAFFVHAKVAGSAGFTLDNSDRVHSKADFLKKKTEKDNLITLKITKAGLSTKTTVYFIPEATTEFDGQYDAFKMFAPYSQCPQFYSITPKNQTKLSISALPENFSDNTTVPLGIRSSDGGQTTISLEKFNGFEQTHVYFEDIYTGEIFNLRDRTEYSCNIASGYVSDRFVLHFNLNQAPVYTNMIENQEATEDIEFYFQFNENTFIDPENDEITYNALLSNKNSLPAWLNFSAETRTFS